MKKTPLLSGLLGIILLASCTKEHTCTCEIAKNGVLDSTWTRVDAIGKSTKKEAVRRCHHVRETINNWIYTSNCHIN